MPSFPSFSFPLSHPPISLSHLLLASLFSYLFCFSSRFGRSTNNAWRINKLLRFGGAHGASRSCGRVPTLLYSKFLIIKRFCKSPISRFLCFLLANARPWSRAREKRTSKIARLFRGLWVRRQHRDANSLIYQVKMYWSLALLNYRSIALPLQPDNAKTLKWWMRDTKVGWRTSFGSVPFRLSCERDSPWTQCIHTHFCLLTIHEYLIFPTFRFLFSSVLAVFFSVRSPKINWPHFACALFSWRMLVAK